MDSVLLVMRITKHVRPNALRAKQVLDALGAKVLGVVVNGVEMRQGYGHDGGYRRYGYGGYGYRDYDYGDYYADDGQPEETINITAPGASAGPPTPGGPPTTGNGDSSRRLSLNADSRRTLQWPHLAARLNPHA